MNLWLSIASSFLLLPLVLVIAVRLWPKQVARFNRVEGLALGSGFLQRLGAGFAVGGFILFWMEMGAWVDSSLHLYYVSMASCASQCFISVCILKHTGKLITITCNSSGKPA